MTALFGFVALLAASGCSDLRPDDCETGEEGCPCKPGDLCEADLICRAGACIQADASAGSGGDGSPQARDGAPPSDARAESAADGADASEDADAAGDAETALDGGDAGGDAASDGSADADAGCPDDDPCCGYLGGGTAPACPLAGEDPDADGQPGGGESWTGTCSAAGECLVCSDAGDCDDGNPCSIDSCQAGACSYDMTTRFGDSCTLTAADDARCVTVGPALLCKLKQGEGCGAHSECASGFCADGVCCNSACDGECDRCDTGAVGTCALDDGLCDGNCAVCGASGACEANPSACTGGCGQCSESDGSFDCAADQAQCPGACDVCQGAGNSFACADSNALCGSCEKCSAGGCVDQLATEDLKNECTQDACNTGFCDGNGACGVESASTPCGGGTCHRCDGAGSCVESTTHADCGGCRMCQSGSCVDQPAGQDLNGACAGRSCDTRIAGWIDVGGWWECGVYASTDTSKDGMCNGAGSCFGTTDVCSGNAGSDATDPCPGSSSSSCRQYVRCGTGCQKSCQPNGAFSSYDDMSEVCWTDFQQHDCPSGQVCGNFGDCIVPCAYPANACPSGQECCAVDGSECWVGDVECECSTYDCF